MKDTIAALFGRTFVNAAPPNVQMIRKRAQACVLQMAHNIAKS